MMLTKLEAQIHLKSGRIIRLFVEKITTTRQNDGVLSAIKVDGARGWPLYLRLDDVSAVTTSRVPFWRGLPR